MPFVNANKRRITIAAFTLASILANPPAAAALSESVSQTASAARSAAATQTADYFGFGASAPAPVELVMHSGAGGFMCGGLEYYSPAPVWIDDSLFLPFRAIAEAFGARIDYVEDAGSKDPSASAAAGRPGRGAPLDSSRITGDFMGNEFIFYPGADYYTLNGIDAELPELLRFIDDTAYIPSRAFDACIGTQTSYDGESGAISILLEDDGGVRDLSGLLGEIREPSVGNSYYNWSIDVPIKSMLLSSSFSGDDVLIYSSLRDVYIEISVRPGEGLTPEYYASNHDSITDDFYVESAQAYGKGTAGYVQAALSGYGAFALMRIYPRARYDYAVTVIAVQDEYGGEEFDAKELMADNQYNRLLDSFEIRAFGADDENIRDLSQVVDGRIVYIDYLDIPENKTLLTPWSVSVFPAWNLLFESSGYNIITVLGENEDENLAVTVEKMPPQVTAGEFLDNYAELDAERFNGDAYRLLGTKSHKIGGRAVLDIFYALNPGAGAGGNSGGFMFYERLIPSGEIFFRLRLKIKKQQFDNKKDIYIGLLDSFSILEEDLSKITNYLTQQEAALRKLRISEADAPVKIGDTADKWSSSLPGNWIETDNWSVSDFEDFGVPGYCDPEAGAFIFVSYEPYDDAGAETDGAGRLSSMEYAQSLIDDEYEEEEGFVIGEPAPAAAGGNDFAVIAYTREPDYYDYNDLYPGYPFSGEIYILADADGVYFIYAEMPYVLKSQSNKRVIDIFLSEFRAGSRFTGIAKAPADPADNSAEASAAAKAPRTGAVG